MRVGKWKLIERLEDGRVHLYDVIRDLGERDDVAAQHPDVVARLRERLHAWYRDVDAKFLRERDGRVPWRPAAK